jgi:DNA-directed RNA polymerase specialized sigma24 family protein
MSAPGEVIPKKERGPCATRSEKLAAFAALTPEENGKLLKSARYFAWKFSGVVNDADGEDVYQDACMRAIDKEDTRNWSKEEISFLGFMRGCIRSVASQWYKHSRYTELLDDPPDTRRHDKQVEAAMLIAKMREALKDRPNAVEIFDLKGKGFTAREIQEELGIPENVYAAAVKWIERTLREGTLGNEKI